MAPVENPDNDDHQRSNVHPLFVAIAGVDGEENIEQLLKALRCSKSRHKPNRQIPTFPSTGDNPLHYAARFGRQRALETLLDDENGGLYRLHMNSRNDRHETPLMLAASIDDSQHAAVVHCIMALEPNATNGENEKVDPAKKVHRKPLVDVNWRNCDHQTALDIAARAGSMRIITELLLCAFGETTNVYPLTTILSALRVAVEAGQLLAAECIASMLNLKLLEQCTNSVRLLMLSRPLSPGATHNQQHKSVGNCEIYKQLLPLLEEHVKARRQCQRKNSAELQHKNNNNTPPHEHSKADWKRSNSRMKLLLLSEYSSTSSSSNSDDIGDDDIRDDGFVFIHRGSSSDIHNNNNFRRLLSIPDGVQELSSSHLQIGKPLGSGSYGTVYEGTLDGHRVAIKRLRCNSALRSERQVLRATLHEARIHAQICHQSIVQFFGVAYGGGGNFDDLVSTDNNTVSLVMQLVEHCCDMDTLFVAPGRLADSTRSSSTATHELVDADGIKKVKQAVSNSTVKFEGKLEIAAQVAEAVRYLHQVKGFVHGDIKPSNVLITEHVTRQPNRTAGTLETIRSYHAYLVDFGITRVVSFDDVNVIDDDVVGSDDVDDGISSNNISFGNAFQAHRGAQGYCSPEVLLDTTARTINYDQSSDMWALCITLLEMFISAPAYGPNAGLENIYNLFMERVELPSLQLVECTQVREVLSSGLSYDARQRATAVEIADKFKMLVAEQHKHRHQVQS